MRTETLLPDTVESVKEGVIKDTAWYGFATYLSQGLGIVSAVLIRRFLGPAGMGVWTALMLLPTYTNYSHFGILNAAEREIPFLNGKKEWREAARVRNVTFAVMLVAASFSVLALLGLALWQRDSSPPEVTASFPWVILVALGQLGFGYFGVLARTAKQFRDLGLLAMAAAILNIVAIVVLTSRFGVSGMLLATAIVYAGMAIYLALRLGSPLRPEIHWREIKHLSAIGLPIMLYSIITDTLMNIDKITTVALLGTTSLGIYTLATMVKTYAWTVPSVIGIVLYPRLQERYGATGDLNTLKNMFLYPMAILAGLTPILIGALYFGTVFLAHTLLPDYVSGLGSVRNMVVGTFFLAITLPAAQLLVTLNKQIVLILIGLIGVATAVGLNTVLVHRGMDIAGIALGTSFAYFVTATATIFRAARTYLPSLADRFRLILETFVPFVYATLILFGLDLLLPTDQFGGATTIVIILVKLTLFTVACLPLVWYADRQTLLVGAVRAAFVTRLHGLRRPAKGNRL
ncbi:MAG: oligosaccharide flippase family protein [Chloroflexi bacterium]|nr:oligosaccharide flippase family protein [Chloroflexota bacterium]